MVGNLLTIAPVLLIFVGYALRVWRLSSFSITYDELDSILFADMPLRNFFAALATYEPHPPFYYLFLHGWLNLAGRTDFALRFPSAIFGTLAVAAAYPAVRCIGGRAAGLAGIVILAVSQLSIAYSQDGRMYAALQAFVTLYLAGLLLHLRKPTRRSAAVLTVAGLLAVYTHYHGLLVVALGVLAIAVIVPRRDLWTQLRPCALILALYLPWVVFARQIFLAYRGWIQPVSPWEVLQRSAVAYSIGVGVEGIGGNVVLFVMPVLAVAGVVSLIAARRWRWLIVLLYLSVLPLVAVMVGAATGRPLFTERYLIVVTPAYLTLAAVGLTFVCQAPLARPVAAAALVALSAVALPAYYWPASSQNPDFRSTVTYIEKSAGPAAIVVLPPPQEKSIRFYLEDHLPSYAARDRTPADTIGAELVTQLRGSREAWFVRYATDPGDNAIASWLESNGFFIADRWITQNHVLTYSLAPSAELVARPASEQLANGVKITSIQVGVNRIRPGGRILVGFQWATPEAGLIASAASAKISLRLIDPWGQTAASLDRLLVNPAQVVHLAPPPIWQAALSVPGDAVPGPYHLEARFYDSSSGRPVLVADSAGPQKLALELGNATIEPADSATLDRSGPPAVDAVLLLPGLYAQRVELAGGPFSQYSHLAANFVWASQLDHPGPVIPELGLRAASGQIVASALRAEIDQPDQLAQLRAGERVREHLDLSLRPVPASGAYTVLLRTSPDRPWVALGSIEITVEPTRVRAVPMTQTRSDLFDGVIRLIGTNVPTSPVRAGSAFTVSLDWHAEGRPTAAYTVFVHLVQGSGQPISQSDAPPGGAGRPTTDWVAGDDVEDQHQIALPSTIATGTYDLVAGLYQADTGRRAEVVGSSIDGETVQLGSIVIGPP